MDPFRDRRVEDTKSGHYGLFRWLQDKIPQRRRMHDPTNLVQGVASESSRWSGWLVGLLGLLFVALVIYVAYHTTAIPLLGGTNMDVRAPELVPRYRRTRPTLVYRLEPQPLSESASPT
jgi:hypothetical protein